mgnify:CR=1 FL=1|jgi:hypothetical protein
MILLIILLATIYITSTIMTIWYIRKPMNNIMDNDRYLNIGQYKYVGAFMPIVNTIFSITTLYKSYRNYEDKI